MKREILFALASLILVGGMVAIAIPSAVQAAPKHTWCYGSSSGTFCNFNSKGECKKAATEAAEGGAVILVPCGKGFFG